MAARKLRAERICCRIVRWDISAEEIEKEAPNGLLLCSASDATPVGIHPDVLSFNGPILALGSSSAALNQALGGECGMYSPLTGMTEVRYSECPLLDQLESGQRLLRGVIPMRLPADAQVIATIGAEQMAIGFSLGEQRRFGLQVELEQHDPDTTRLLTNFAMNICGCTAWWDDEAFVRDATDSIRRAAGEGNALCLLTGGLYSSVAALLAARAIGNRLTCYYVDTGLSQDNHDEWFFDFFQQKTGISIIFEDHRDRFLQALKGIRDQTGKREAVDSMMAVIRRDIQRTVPLLNAVVRGHSYDDDSGDGSAALRAGVICAEPLKDLFIDEVRQIGRYLGMPENILSRQAIPTAGLALNIRGEVTVERLNLLHTADNIFRQNMEEGNQARRLSAYYTALEPDADGYTITLHAITASDLGLSRAARVPFDILENTTESIRSACPGVHRVMYSLTPHLTN